MAQYPIEACCLCADHNLCFQILEAGRLKLPTKPNSHQAFGCVLSSTVQVWNEYYYQKAVQSL